MRSKKPVILVIRDGWGYRKSCKKNCICRAKTPVTDKLMKMYPNTLLDASNGAVGLPRGYQGNSEVGHMTIGSGRIMYQSLERINQAIKDKSFYSKKAFLDAIKNCKNNKSSLHIIGLLQVEGVHSHIDHLFALLNLCKKEKLKDVWVHVITDGRDSPVKNSIKHIKDLKQKLKMLGFGKIASVSGRYYAMDRDQRWDRTKKAYDCIAKGDCNISFSDPIKSVKESHNKNFTDEFILPRKSKEYEGFCDKDSVIFFNFRTDRTRQLTQAIVEKNFSGWKRKPLDVYYVAMTQYYSPMKAKVAFEDVKVEDLLGKVVSDKGLRQLRISETEKYAHVTFFLNGQFERPYKKEDRILIHSPKVATYDLKPEMSAEKITKQLCKEIDNKKYDLIVVNLVNCDMVGHTGIDKAIIKAVETVDKSVGNIVEHGLGKGYSLIIFADHGNAEDQTKMWRTSHTTNPVPVIIVTKDSKIKSSKLREGCGLKDIAPTVLDIMGIKKPKKMTGNSLIK